LNINNQERTMKEGNKYGAHRVIEPKGVLPQPAWKIDNNMDEIYDNEILLDVIRLNIDSASFYQICEEYGRDEKAIAKRVKALVDERGKHHNPVTGSGGMLIGRVDKIGSKLESKINLKPGDKVATLVSLSLTPLRVDEVKKVYLDVDQVEIKGKAILFESGVYAKLPDDMTENLALSILDVAGAPPQAERLVNEGDNVLVIGANGKSGLLCCQVAKDKVGSKGMVIGTSRTPAEKSVAKELGLVDKYFSASATNSLDVYNKVYEATDGKMCDVVINCVNVQDTEMASILACKDMGTVYFFSMATSFTKAALGAEGIGHDITMIIGNGYAHEHAQMSLDVVRKHPKLKEIFEKKYA
jgi:L-erythro-3,5-diaminohexanoate dehydrogenase